MDFPIAFNLPYTSKVVQVGCDVCRRGLGPAPLRLGGGVDFGVGVKRSQANCVVVHKKINQP